MKTVDIRFLQEETAIIHQSGSRDQGVMPPADEKEVVTFFPEPRDSFESIRLFSGSHVVCWGEWTVNDLQYSYHRLYYVIGGTAWYIADGQKTLLEKGCLYLMPTHPHHYRMEHDPADPLDVLWCHFEMDPPVTDGMIRYDPENDDEMLSVLQIWDRVCALPQPGYEMYHAVALLMHLLERRIPLTFKKHPFTAAEQYMKEHIGERFTVEKLAEHFGYSRAHFSREFKNSLGMSPAKYMQMIRMSRAGEMLRCGMNVSQVCATLGFPDRKSFFRMFKAYYHTTTTAYLSEHKMQP